MGQPKTAAPPRYITDGQSRRRLSWYHGLISLIETSIKFLARCRHIEISQYRWLLILIPQSEAPHIDNAARISRKRPACLIDAVILLPHTSEKKFLKFSEFHDTILYMAWLQVLRLISASYFTVASISPEIFLII